MKKINTSDSEIMEWRKGGGFLSFAGIFFLGSGLFVLFSPLQEVSTGGDLSDSGVIVFGSVCALVGVGLAFGRGGLILNLRDKKVTTWWGVLFPFKSTERVLEEFEKVTITKEVRQSDKSSYTVYPVRLSGKGKPIKFGEPRDYKDSRIIGEEMAKFLGMNMEDSSSGTSVLRSADQLDESIGERLRRTGEKVELPEAPANMKTKISQEGDTTVLDIPPASFSSRMGLLVFQQWPTLEPVP